MASMEKLNAAALAFLEELESVEPAEEKDTFRIENDMSAEWAIEQLRDHAEEADRLKKMIAAKREELDAQEKQIDDRLEGESRYLKGKLEEYFRSGVKAKETKTQKTYKLLSGSLIMKKESYSYSKDEKRVIQAVKDLGKEEYVETVEKLKWAEFKKQLVFDGEKVYDPETGTVIDGVTAVLEPERFEVKL